MANIPNISKLSATSVDILNVIRNNATADYKNYIPEADKSLDSLRSIGNTIMNYPAFQNEFLTALINRIGMVIIKSETYRNPWAIFKKGILEMGETIEEIFVNIAKPFKYNPEVAENKVFARVMPDVRAAFHPINYEYFYKQTVQRAELKKAFMTWDGITNLIAEITNVMYTSANYDEYQVMKYLIARNILNGRVKGVTIPAMSTANIKSIVGKIKGISNNLTFMQNGYNPANVPRQTLKENQYIIIDSTFDADVDVELLATAFNMSRAEFEARKVLIDGFGAFDDERLNALFGDNPDYTPITEAEKQALSSIPAMIVSADWFMIYDVDLEFDSLYNPQGRYWNYWLHTWKTFSVSPFENAAVFVQGEPTVTSVTVTPETVSTYAGATVALKADVVTSNFASKAVTWESSDENVTVDIYGNVTIGDDAVSPVTITATSTVDSSKSDSATISFT